MRARVVTAALLALMVLPACGGTDRPEGVVERWLVSLNQGPAGQPQQYAPDRLTQRILPHWARRDPGDLDVIEVGKGGRITCTCPTLTGRAIAFPYTVPFRVKRVNGPTVQGSVGLSKASGDWRVVSIFPAGTTSIATVFRVPSRGGARIGNAAAVVWLEALGVAFVFVVISVALMATDDGRRLAAV